MDERWIRGRESVVLLFWGPTNGSSETASDASDDNLLGAIGAVRLIDH